ncbi:MAG: shikimate dehydrogenase [Dehalococcoidales bacterium]|nr:shikimate dehydrogenase [Dehalococcoidales bacterium]
MISEISAGTRICGLIGNPVEHSLSPAMHNAAFRKTGLDYMYLPFKVTENNLSGAIHGVRSLNFKGLNVTIPHKVAIIPFLDELEPMAEKIGAVNTIVNDNGYLKGYNTDAGGFIRSLTEKGIDPGGKNIVILGAGGASRAVSFTLAEQGADIVILNRRQEMSWAEELTQNILRFFKSSIKAKELNDANLKSVLKSADILVNATSVGMSPNIDQTLITGKLIRPQIVVFDIIYNPIKTRLLAEAEKAGARTIGGLNMLVWQGALSFKLWTGVEAPVDIMKKEAVNILSKTV